MAYREQVRTVSAAEGIADDGSIRPIAPSAAAAGVVEDTDGTRRIRAASADMARGTSSGRPLEEASSMLERRTNWTTLWQGGAPRAKLGDDRLKT